jgi:5-methylcytosine-specific restriction protein A
MSTWLLTWNPARWDWESLQANIRAVQRFGRCAGRWSCGNARQISAGERFFLLRQGRDPAGVVGSGFVTSDPFSGVHWLGRGSAWFVNIEFDCLLDTPAIRRLELLRGAESLRAKVWATQASGVRIPALTAAALERRWAEATGLGGALPATSESVDEDTLPEGAVRRVVLNAYERNAVARKRCLEHHGHLCSVCGIRLSDVYGAIADGFIEVHHVVPLSRVGRRYRVDPAKDLVPICPNCHSIVHRRAPALGIDEARKLLVRTERADLGRQRTVPSRRR